MIPSGAAGCKRSLPSDRSARFITRTCTRDDRDRAVVLQNRAMDLLHTRAAVLPQRRLELMTRELSLRESVVEHLTVMRDDNRPAFDDGLDALVSERRDTDE